MANLPIQRAEVRPGGPGDIPQPRSRGTGAASAALIGLGRESVDASERITRQAERQAAVEAARISAETELEARRALVEESERMEPGGVGFYDRMGERFDEISSAAVERATDERAAAGVSNRMSALKTDILTRATALESSEKLRKRFADVAETIETSRNIVISDPGLLKSKIVATEVLIENAGLKPDAADKLRERAREGLTSSALTTLIQRDPAGTARRLNNGEFDNLIDPADKTRFLGAAAAEEERQKRLEKAEFKARTDDHLASLQTAGVGIPGFSSRAGAVLEGDDLADFRAAEALAKNAHGFTQVIKYETPADISARLAAARPTPGSERFFDELQAFEHMQRTANQLLAQREKDAAAYVAQMPEVKAAYAAGGMENAVKVSLDMQERIGIEAIDRRALPIPMGQNIVQDITSAPTDQRAAKILELQASLGGQYLTVLGELVNDHGLGEQYHVLAMAADDPMQAQGLSAVIDTPASELKKLLDGADVTDMNRALGKELEEFTRAVMAGNPTAARVEQINNMQAVLSKRALVEMNGGMSAADAAKFAAAHITDRFETVGLMYIPRVLQGELINTVQVERFAETLRDPEMIRAFNPQPFGDPSGVADEEHRLNTIIQLASDPNRSYWATNDTGTGAFLMLRLQGGGALPMLSVDKQLYTFDFLKASRSTPIPGESFVGEPGGA